MSLPSIDQLSVKSRVTLATIAIFLASLWSMSYFSSQMLRKDMEKLLGEQQLSTVTVVASNLGEEVAERQRALRSVAATLGTLAPGRRQAVQARLDQMPLVQSLFNGGIVAFAKDGSAIAASSHAALRAQPGNHGTSDAVAHTLRTGLPAMDRPLYNEAYGSAIVAMTVPIPDARGTVVGVLEGITVLNRPSFLDKVSDNAYGKTGGYMLVAPSDRLVVTATDKRRALEKLPPTGAIALVDRFVAGYEGSGVVKNPAGVEVLASARRIPQANWYVAVAIPTAEAFAPIHAMRTRMAWATILLTVLASTLIWWVVKYQLAPMLAAMQTLSSMSETSQPMAPLAVTRRDEIGTLIESFNRLLATLAERRVALKENERKLSVILENVDAFIYLKDTEGRYQFANRPLREYFHASQEDIVGQTDERFFSAHTAAQLRRNDQLILAEGRTLKIDETVQRKTSGEASTHFSVKLPLRDAMGKIYALCGISTDITERKKVEEALRIAAIAFECQEGIVVMDADRRILRVNKAFTQITGYSCGEAEGLTTALLRSEKHPHTFYEDVWAQVQLQGTWDGEMWHRRKNGENYPERVTLTAVRDAQGSVTHYVGTLIDATSSQLREQQRLEHEANHRDVLVREVHHRIKNNLQGIIGILRQFAQQHPETAPTINQAIGQVKGISVIHGLQGRANSSSVRVCELVEAIADEIRVLWNTSIQIDLPTPWHPRVIAAKEAVPIALVLNELILNAVKHAGVHAGDVCIALRKGEEPESVRVQISNTGQLQGGKKRSHAQQNGIPLVKALMPRQGGKVSWTQQDAQVITLLELTAPVVSVEPDLQV